MSLPPTFKQLQYLIALSTEPNFAKAAAKCFVSQSTLSAGLMEMENLLGQKVLNRGRKKTTLTPFGQEVLKTAQNVTAQMNALTARAQSLSAPLSGPFRLGLIPTIAPYLLPQILPPLQKQFPNLEFQIVENLTATLMNKLNEGALDLAILAFPYDTAPLNQMIFKHEEFFAAAPKGTFKNKKIKIDDLKSQQLLLLEDGHCLRDHALSACKIPAGNEQKNLSATSLQTLIQMAAQGGGVTMLPAMVTQYGAMPKALEIKPFHSPKPTRQIGAAWDDKAQSIDTITAVLQALKHHIQ